MSARAIAAAAAITAVAVAAPLAVTALAATRTIAIGDNSFSPASASVDRGSIVKWVWRGRHAHNVTVVSGPARFSSPTQKTGTFSRKLSRKGTYRIICTIHGAKQSLTLRVR